jgi:hypothetical protein
VITIHTEKNRILKIMWCYTIIQAFFVLQRIWPKTTISYKTINKSGFIFFKLLI